MRPMGYDSFGLNAENAAIRDGGHPREIVAENITRIRAQMKRMGWAIDWDREIASHEPEYYRWTQWLFLQFFEAGQAYRKEAPVKWCPKDQTVLANEQVINGRCERCGTEVESKSLEQWFFRYTTYADELLDEMELLESWPERVLAMQRNWIGRSEGAEILFHVDELDIDIPVFTTRPDTLFGATFFLLAPEHHLISKLVEGTAQEREVLDYVRRTAARTFVEREEKPKDGRLHRSVCDESGERRTLADLGRRLRVDGVRLRRRSAASRSRRPRLRVRSSLRPGVEQVIAPVDGSEPELPYVAKTDEAKLVNSAVHRLPAPEVRRQIVEWLGEHGRAGRRSATACGTG
jgi:leucyl-tRNA synthetase